jgi:hypothetical protein
MEPKEKAKDIWMKCFQKQIEVTGNGDGNLCVEIALITVDEIMKAPHENSYIKLISTDAENTDWFWNKFDEYWNEVKNEIEKL